MRKTLRKILSALSAFSLLFQILRPVAVYAQGATPSPTPEASATVTPLPSVTPTPDSTTAPSPSVSPTVEPTVSPSPSASLTVTPTPSPVESPVPSLLPTALPLETPVVSPSASPSASPEESATPTASPLPDNNPPTGPPANQTTTTPVPSVSETPTSPTPTVTPENKPEIRGHLEAVVLSGSTSIPLDTSTQTSATSASLTTDKPDYSPTETVLITGTGFAPETTYTLVISSQDQPPVNFSTSITTNATGGFIYAYQLDGTYRPNYTVEVKDSSGTVVATTPFTDSLKKAFDQCANKDSTLGSCKWINGALQSSNSNYHEGMSVPQRVVFSDIDATAGNVHTLTFRHQATKGGTHAYDFLTAYNQGNSPTLTLNECNDLGATLGPICSSLRSGPNSLDVNAPDDPFISKDGSTQNRINAYEAAFGNRTIRIYGNSAISAGSLSLSHDVANSGDTGDSYILYTLSWTSASINILVEMAGHISVSNNGSGYSWGTGLGASSISGGPYHFKLDRLDGDSIGEQDNQIQAGAIPPPPTTVTQTSPTSIYLGQSASDSATLTGSNGTVTGSVSFFICGPNSSPTACTSGGTQVGGPVTLSGGQATSAPFTPQSLTNSTDYYCFRAEYSPDQSAQYSPSSHTNTTTECFSVTTPPTGTLVVHKVFTDEHPNSNITINVSPGGLSQVTNGSGDATFSGLTPGTYTAHAVEPTGYSEATNDCLGVSVVANQTTTCTITDSPNPKLTVTKVVISNNGGTKVVSDFPLFVGATQVTSGVQNTFDPGTYTVSETPDAGYAETISGDCNSQTGSITLALGDVKSCTITNDDIAPQLTVIKHVVNNNGGTKNASDFTMNVTGTNVSNSSFTGAESPGTTVTLDAGAYSVDESAVAGYTKTLGANCSGTIAVGQTKTCTITNDDQAAQLTLQKHVISDNGGQATAANFMLHVKSNSNDVNGSPQAGSESGAAYTLNAGTYTVSEDTPSNGYAQTGIVCDNQQTDTVTLSPGDNKVCTITNDDVQPRLTVTKLVTNNDGGLKVIGDFPLFVDQTPVVSGVQNGFNAGTYTVSETPQSGYSGPSFGGDCSPGGQVSLSVGDVKSCTLANDDIAPTLMLTKTVTNDDGGTATASAWTLSATGSERSFSGTTPASGTVKAGVTYTLSESGGPAGYAPGAWRCDGGTLNGDQLTLGLGENVTCSIDNDDVAPKLTLVKTVTNNNGGNKQVSDFTLKIDGNTVTSGVANVLSAGAHTATEVGLSGYTASSWGGDCNPDGTITLAPGDDKTCTITNDDQAATLTVIKHVITDNGGDKTAADFAIVVIGDNASPSAFLGSESGTVVTLDAGQYDVQETELAGYSASYSGGCRGTIANGESQTCTITNDDETGHLIVHKVTNPTNDQTVFSVTLSAAPASGETTRDLSTSADVNYEVNAGTYSVSEALKSGWQETGNTCQRVVIANGQTKECTITNTQLGSISGYKYELGNQNPLAGWLITLFLNGTYYDQQTTTSLGYSFLSLLPGNYSLVENLLSGWSPISSPAPIALTAGQNSTANNFVNFHNVSISGQKFNDLNGNGVKDNGEPGLAGWTINLDKDANGSVDKTEITDQNGNYSFTDLGTGTYGVREVGQSNWIQTTANPADITVVSGQNVSGVDFGNFHEGYISGHKWNDLNGNGVWDKPDEPPLQGWKIYLDRPEGEDIYRTTDADGYYYFGDLGPGQYRVYEKLSEHPGWVQTAPNGNEYVLNMTSNAQGLNNPNYDFGNKQNPVKIKASKVICKTESDLPNWGNHEAIIDANTAQDYVNSHEGCSLAEAWDFQYGPAGAGSFGSFQTNTSSLGSPWTTFGVGQEAVIYDLSNFGGRIETREVFPNDTYLPFSNSGNTSAEFYCTGDVYNYDNWEWINNPQYGQTYYCVAFNTPKEGTIIVRKVTNPQGRGDEFLINLTQGGQTVHSSTLTGGQSDTYDVLSGGYVLGEEDALGWDLTSVSCNSNQDREVGDPRQGFTLSPGETVDCTFTNTKIPKLTIVKKVDPENDNGLFNLSINGTDYATNVGNNGSTGAQFANIGENSFAETTTEGTTLSDYTSVVSGDGCGGTAENGTITLAAGDDKTCTITNTRKGRIVVTKETDQKTDLEFSFETDYGNSFPLRNGEQNDSGLLPPGTYRVTETDIPQGWRLGSATCSDGSDPSAIELNPGEEVTCTFINSRRTGDLTVYKMIDEGDGNFVWANPGIFSWGLSEGETSYDMGSTQTFNADQYNVYESTVPDYRLVGWFFGNPDESEFSCDSLPEDEENSVLPASVSVTDEGPTEITICNARKTGSVTVNKEVDTDGDRVFEGGNAAANDLGFRWQLDSETDNPTRLMGETANPVNTGQHSVSEFIPEDYHFVGWFPTGSTEFSCATPYSDSLPAGISVSENQPTAITLCNARDMGRITVIKDVVPNDSSSWDIALTGPATRNATLTDGQSTGEIALPTGLYNISEAGHEGTNGNNYTSSYRCLNGKEVVVASGGGTSISDLSLPRDGSIVCTFTNEMKRGSIKVTKHTTPVESPQSFAFNLGGAATGSASLTDGQSHTFPNLLPGQYTLGETIPSGWVFDSATCGESRFTNGGTLNLNPGQTISCSFNNVRANPTLTISKTNNKLGIDQSPGGNVQYSITVEAQNNVVYRVLVTDLLPDGFKYRSGSWSATKNGSPLALAEPSYASPGVWDVGQMEAGDKVVLNLIADISGSQQPGLYKDVAWAYGCSTDAACAVGGPTAVLAGAVNPGKLDTAFVGTEVNVVTDPSSGASYNVEKINKVLGASISLPETGAQTGWLALGLASFVLGISSLGLGLVKNKKSVRRHAKRRKYA